MFYMQYVIHCN